MFAAQIAATIPTASLSRLDHVAQDLWRAYAAGMLDEPDAETLAAALEARRATLRGTVGSGGGEPSEPLLEAPTRFPPMRKQTSPDRARSRQRRRTLAASGPLPPALAAKFTPGEQAVLAIVAAEVSEHGVCDRSYDEVAARAGVCRTLAKQAIRLAARYGLLTIELRPRPGRKHLTNLVRIKDAAWRSWLMHGERRIGGRKPPATGIRFRKEGREAALAHRPLENLATPWNGSKSPGEAGLIRSRRGL